MNQSNTSLSNLKELSEIVQAAVTTIAIVVGGFWSYNLFIKKRQKYPRAKIEHKVSHRKIRDGEFLLNIDVTVSNSGDVLLLLETGEITVRQILPPRAELSRLIQESNKFLDEGTRIIEWDLIARQSISRNILIEIEPGESHQIFSHFVVGSHIQTILLESAFQNVKKRRRQFYWQLTTIHDLLPSSSESLIKN